MVSPPTAGTSLATRMVAIGGSAAVMAPVRAGRLNLLAVTSKNRVASLPDRPAAAEFVPGYEASGFAGISVPKGTPAAVIDLLNKQLNAALADPKIKGRIVELGGTPTGGTPAEFGKLVVEATEKWAKVIKVAGIKPE